MNGIEDLDDTDVPNELVVNEIDIESEAGQRVIGAIAERLNSTMGPTNGRPVYKPDCSNFDSAIGIDDSSNEEVFLAKIGENLIIEYTNHPWWETTRYIVEKIFENGDIRLWNAERIQYSMTNWKIAPKNGINIFLENKRGVILRGKRATGRKKEKSEIVQVTPVALNPDGSPIKRGRGRPKGSKNRATLAREATQQQKEEVIHEEEV